ncbi:MAG: chemotaxis protein CheW [Arcobacter sp.]|uniref:chemotaxis protein CheW n=1 Tax=Arcobacter sp. TaxID=1872629 RepID=UPI003D047A54
MTNTNVSVELEKLEKLLNKVGDLVITNSMMAQTIDNLPSGEAKKSLLEKINLLQRHIVELQDYATDIRMVKFESMYETYNNFLKEIIPKNKKIKFILVGGETKVDKSLIELLDTLIKKIISNAVSYGIETVEERVIKDKNEEATLKLIVHQLNGQISFCIEDDGVGLNKEDIEEMTGINEYTNKFNADLEVESETDKGTKVSIIVPLTHSILDGLNIKIGNNIFILPTSSIVESIQPTTDMIKFVGDGSSQLLMLRNEFIPIIRLYEYFNIVPKSKKLEDGILIIVKSQEQKAAFLIDEFLQQQQVVLKAIETNFRKVESVAGATVRGDGSIGIIIDVKTILEAN